MSEANGRLSVMPLGWMHVPAEWERRRINRLRLRPFVVMKQDGACCRFGEGVDEALEGRWRESGDAVLCLLLCWTRLRSVKSVVEVV